MDILSETPIIEHEQHAKSLVIKSKEDELMETLLAFFKIENENGKTVNNSRKDSTKCCLNTTMQ